MTRGRKPKPTTLKVIEGNRSKTVIRPDAIRPKSRASVLSPPSHLSGPAKAEWKRLSKGMSQLGLLSDLDRGAFAAYCQAYGRWKQAEDALDNLRRKDDSGMGAMLVTTKAGNTIQNPLVGIANKAMGDMVRYAAEFGFTPSARARITMDDPTEGSKFQGLIGAKRA
jgi:P27 family predicted phage terminase small subunit